MLIKAFAETLTTLMQGSAQMIATIQAAELERLRETKEERIEEKKYRREAREAEREAKRQAAIETNIKRASKKGEAQPFAPEQIAAEIQICNVCRGAIQLQPWEVELHHAHQHDMFRVRPSGQGAASNAGN